MSIQDYLQKASFRNVPFLIKSSQRQGGRKTATHDYPNTDHRFIEDLGKTVPVFQIEAVITGKDADYILKRDKFIDALEQAGSGQLSHPFYTNLTVMVVNYTLTETFTDLGAANFSIDFGITGKSIYPAADKGTSALLDLKIEKAVANAKSWLGENFKPQSNSRSGHAFNTNMFSNFILQYNSALLNLVSQQTIEAKPLSTIESHINAMESDKDLIVNDSEDLSEQLVDSFDYFEDTDAESQVLFNSYTKIFFYQQTTTLPAATTIQRVLNEENFWRLTSVISLLAILYAYKNAALIEYNTSDDLIKVRQSLEVQYQYIARLKNLDYDLYIELKDIRANMVDFFDRVRQNVYNVTTIDTTQLPLSVLTYQYYGSLDNETDLLNLNNIIDPSFIEGDFKILVD